MATVEPIPQGFPRVTPYLHVDGASAAIDFYTGVLGATERMRMPGDTPERIGHAELQLGNGVIMLADEFPDMEALGPKSIGGWPVTIHVYVGDVDAVFDKAVRAGARALQEPADQSTGTVPGSSRIRSGTAGTWPPTSRTSHPTRCGDAWPNSPADNGHPACLPPRPLPRAAYSTGTAGARLPTTCGIW